MECSSIKTRWTSRRFLNKSIRQVGQWWEEVKVKAQLQWIPRWAWIDLACLSRNQDASKLHLPKESKQSIFYHPPIDQITGRKPCYLHSMKPLSVNNIRPSRRSVVSEEYKAGRSLKWLMTWRCGSNQLPRTDPSLSVNSRNLSLLRKVSRCKWSIEVSSRPMRATCYRQTTWVQILCQDLILKATVINSTVKFSQTNIHCSPPIKCKHRCHSTTLPIMQWAERMSWKTPVKAQSYLQ